MNQYLFFFQHGRAWRNRHTRIPRQNFPDNESEKGPLHGIFDGCKRLHHNVQQTTRFSDKDGVVSSNGPGYIHDEHETISSTFWPFKNTGKATILRTIIAFHSKIIINNFYMQSMLRNNGIHAIVLDNNLRKYLVSQFCSPSKPADDICFAIFFLFVGEDYDQVDWVRFFIY